jgi:hypothetical protein
VLLTTILDRFLPAGPVVIGIDDTIERRWGRKIAARGIYRDPVRSSHGHFVKTSGLRWLSLMAMVPIMDAAALSLALPDHSGALQTLAGVLSWPSVRDGGGLPRRRRDFSSQGDAIRRPQPLMECCPSQEDSSCLPKHL